VLGGADAVLLGQFINCHLPEDASWTLDDVFMEHLAPLGVPVLKDLPVGHGASNRAFFYGAQTALSGAEVQIHGLG